MTNEGKVDRLQTLVNEAFELSNGHPAFALWREKVIDYEIEASRSDSDDDNRMTK